LLVSRVSSKLYSESSTVSQNGKTVEEWFQLGFHAEYPEDKIRYYSKVLEFDPKNKLTWNGRAMALVWTNKGIAYCDLGEYVDAIVCFEKALELDENNPDIFYNKGIANSELQRYELAAECFDMTLRFDPDHDHAKINKGMMLDILGNSESAIKCFEDINIDTVLDGKQAIVLNQKGISYLHLGRYEDAVSCFAKALNLDPEYRDAKNNMNISMEKLSGK